jgi:hypothetical protein
LSLIIDLLQSTELTQPHQVAMLMPLAVSAIAVLCAIFIHALVLGATVNIFRYERRRGRAGAGLRIDLCNRGVWASVASMATLAFKLGG